MAISYPAAAIVDRPIELKYLKLGSLVPSSRNARTHSKTQVAQIAASIREFGFVNPILIDESGEIIAGHGRLLAAKQLGQDQAPTILLSGLSEPQKRALRIADNKIAQNAGWDTDLLKSELLSIGDLAVEFDLSLTGFATGELDVLLCAEDDDTDDAVPSLKSSPVTRLGDIWRLGGHRVGCGDGRDAQFLKQVMPGLADAAFCDPPYNVRISGHAVGKGKVQHREFPMASGEMSSAEFEAFLRASMNAAKDVSREGAVHFVCMDWRHIGELTAAANAVYDTLLNLCVWKKSNAGMGSLYRSRHELIFVYRVGSTPHFNAVELGRHGRNRTNVWDYSSVNTFGGSRRDELALHPTVKPVAMVVDAIKDVTRRGELVLDTFLGSGTTLIAAERAGRCFAGLDLDPAYVDCALERWTDLSGEQPILAESGATFSEVNRQRGSAG